jgi:hypothetical protein
MDLRWDAPTSKSPDKRGSFPIEAVIGRKLPLNCVNSGHFGAGVFNPVYFLLLGAVHQIGAAPYPLEITTCSRFPEVDFAQFA